MYQETTISAIRFVCAVMPRRSDITINHKTALRTRKHYDISKNGCRHHHASIHGNHRRADSRARHLLLEVAAVVVDHTDLADDGCTIRLERFIIGPFAKRAPSGAEYTTDNVPTRERHPDQHLSVQHSHHAQ